MEAILTVCTLSHTVSKSSLNHTQTRQHTWKTKTNTNSFRLVVHSLSMKCQLLCCSAKRQSVWCLNWLRLVCDLFFYGNWLKEKKNFVPCLYRIFLAIASHCNQTWNWKAHRFFFLHNSVSVTFCVSFIIDQTIGKIPNCL